MQIITTTDVAVIDEDLRNTATAIAPGSHGITTWLITIHGMLGVGNTFAIQQLFGAHAEGAGAPCVDLDARHRAFNGGPESYAAPVVNSERCIPH